jgi:hypothetical protein
VAVVSERNDMRRAVAVGLGILAATAAIMILDSLLDPRSSRWSLAIAPIVYVGPALAAYWAARLAPRHNIRTGVLMVAPAALLFLVWGVFDEAFGTGDKVTVTGRVVFALLYAGPTALACLLGAVIASVVRGRRRRDG